METAAERLRRAIERERELDLMVGGDRRARLEAQLQALNEREASTRQFLDDLAAAAAVAERFAALLRSWSTIEIDLGDVDLSWIEAANRYAQAMLALAEDKLPSDDQLPESDPPVSPSHQASRRVMGQSGTEGAGAASRHSVAGQDRPDERAEPPIDRVGGSAPQAEPTGLPDLHREPPSRHPDYAHSLGDVTPRDAFAEMHALPEEAPRVESSPIPPERRDEPVTSDPRPAGETHQSTVAEDSGLADRPARDGMLAPRSR